MGPEKRFENKIKQWLKEHDCYFIKYWGGGQFTKSGVPDILASVSGLFVGIEVKAERGEASELQKYNIRKIRESGGCAWIVYPSGLGKLLSNLDDILNYETPMYDEEILK